MYARPSFYCESPIFSSFHTMEMPLKAWGSDTAVIRVIAGIVLLIGGAAITYFLGKKEA